MKGDIHAALGKVAVVDQAGKLATHLGELEAELDAQLARVEKRLRFIDELEERVAALVETLALAQRSAAAFEARLNDLGSSAEAVEQKVQQRADAVTHLLSDINVNLEMLSEQRAVIDHVGEKLARLDFTVQEAQNTLRALQREGLALGAHSRSHPRLDRLPADRAVEEVLGSIADLERATGAVVAAFAYPGGGVTDELVRRLRDTGLAVAFTTERGVADLRGGDPLRLPRINVGRRSSPAALSIQMLTLGAARRPGARSGGR